MRDCSIQPTNHPGDLGRVAEALALLENKAGILASVTNRLGDEGINLEALYVAGIADDLVELAIVSDNPKKAKKILEEF